MKRIKIPKEKKEPERRNAEKAKQDELDKREKKPFVLIDKSADPITNFISNFIRQFKNPTPLGLPKLSELLSLFRTKRITEEKEHVKPIDIMGPTKTVFGSEKKRPTEDGKINESKTISQGIRHTNSNDLKEKYDYEIQTKPIAIKPKIRM